MTAAHADLADHPTGITDAELFAAMHLQRIGLEWGVSRIVAG